MGLDLDYNDGQTPIDEDEKEDLLIDSITNKSELDEFEQKNIEDAVEWSIPKKFSKNEILTEEFIKNVHKKMLGKVWKWGGKFRKSNKNIGVDWPNISTELRKLLGDVGYWIENNTYSQDEIAIRFKHKLVSIHCFSNGNGRHSRLMADILIKNVFEKEVFNWGGGDLINPGNARASYLTAIKEADRNSYENLIQFARN